MSAAVLSANGACVALQAGALVAGYGPDFEHVFLHALGAGCAASGVPAPGADTTAPRISRLRMTRRRFAVGRRRTPLTARTRRGTAFVFRLSEDARTTITISRKQRRRVVLKRRTRAGTNRIAYTGRTRGRSAAPRPLPRDRPRRRRRRQPLRAEAHHVHGQAARSRASVWRRQRSVRSSSLKV